MTVGFEHSIANWFFLPWGLALDTQQKISLVGTVRNLVSATFGNIIGGTILVAGVYWLAYLRKPRATGLLHDTTAMSGNWLSVSNKSR